MNKQAFVTDYENKDGQVIYIGDKTRYPLSTYFNQKFPKSWDNPEANISKEELRKHYLKALSNVANAHPNTGLSYSYSKFEPRKFLGIPMGKKYVDHEYKVNHENMNNIVDGISNSEDGLFWNLPSKEVDKLNNINQKIEKNQHQKKKEIEKKAFIKRAQEYGITINQAEYLYKEAMPRGLENIPGGAGAHNIEDAVKQFERLRTQVKPEKETLKGYNLSENGFQSALKRIVSKSQGSDKYNLSDIAPDPKLRGILGALAGGVAGGGLSHMGGEGIGHDIMSGLGGAALGGTGAYLHGAHERGNVLNTAKLLKQYGMLNPQTLRRAYPLLAKEYQFK